MDQPNPNQRKRLLLALALSAFILLGFDFIGREFFGVGVMGQSPTAPVVKAEAVATPVNPDAPIVPVGADVVRVPLGNERLEGEVTLTGGRVDTLGLRDYAFHNGDAAAFPLFKPEGAQAEYLAMGWLGAGIEGPGDATVWQKMETPADAATTTLRWANATGQTFERTLHLRPNSFVMDVTEKVTNGAALPVSLTGYAQIHRADGSYAHETSSWVNYFGPMGVVGDVTHESKFTKLKDDGESEKVMGKGGWWGITGQYFMAAVMPGEGQETERQFKYQKVGGRDFYTASVAWPSVVVPAGGSTAISYMVYAGPKQDEQLIGIGNHMDRAIDWGWFKAIAKPLHYTLVWLHDHLWNNWALAVIALTLLLKIVTFPLANKSYHAMAKMKKLQPKVEELRKKHEGDQQGVAVAMMELYRSHKVNPMSGCWPVAIQIPIFFAMYKVVLVAFEFRHTPLELWPFSMWVHDMSAMDPYYVLPVLMGISMFVQFKLNPPAADPVQASMFKWMPVFMTVLFLWFPSGLVLYWLTNNVLSIAQQAYIMRKDKAL